ncbi:MAG: flagellar hook protein FlgE [Gemmatimonadetes bacterium]|nr:flagellar hook protein FlgE [Gemmatimonadota bacterium]MBI3568658.1 flagellar hook protein FlgE [Gemmatimonadota bacterium]
MLRSLFAGVSGLRNHQIRMDVIGNNIANVNTVAFKSGRVTFKEGFAQMLQGGSRPPGDQGGINPIQVGLGMQIGSVDTMFSQGNLETTGLNTDVAIQGDSFFVARKGSQSYYTRSGNFQVDANGKLVSPTNGFVIQGKMAVNGVLQDGMTDIQLPFGQKTAAKATSSLKLNGNFDASVPIFDTTDPDGAGPAVAGFNADTRAVAANKDSWTEASMTVYDSLGTKYDVKAYVWKTAANQWDWQVDNSSLVAAGVPAGSISGSGQFTFASDGTLQNTGLQTIAFSPPGADTVSIGLDPGSGVNGVTQFSGSTTAVMRDQNGYGSGTLQNFTIDRTGLITGAFTNGVNVPLAQIMLADFNNPAGLLRVGDNMYQESANSGGAVLGIALQGSQSTLTSGALEMSNVDLAQEFTSMIVAQRGFQANSKVITTSDELLQELVGLKR